MTEMLLGISRQATSIIVTLNSKPFQYKMERIKVNIRRDDCISSQNIPCMHETFLFYFSFLLTQEPTIAYEISCLMLSSWLLCFIIWKNSKNIGYNFLWIISLKQLHMGQEQVGWSICIIEQRTGWYVLFKHFSAKSYNIKWLLLWIFSLPIYIYQMILNNFLL